MIKLPVQQHDTHQQRLLNYFNQLLEPHGVVITELNSALPLTSSATMIDAKTGVKLDDKTSREYMWKIPIFKGPWVKAYPEEVKMVAGEHAESRRIDPDYTRALQKSVGKMTSMLQNHIHEEYEKTRK